MIPLRDDQRLTHYGRPRNFDKQTYRRRGDIERCIGWLKGCRAGGARFEKTAINFLAMVQRAINQRYPRVLDSAGRTSADEPKNISLQGLTMGILLAIITNSKRLLKSLAAHGGRGLKRQVPDGPVKRFHGIEDEA